MEISLDEIIKLHIDDTDLLHLAKSPVRSVTNKRQLYIAGINVGGRPEGMWICNGSDWVAKTLELNNSLYPPCCYIYKINVKPTIKLLYIRNDDEFQVLNNNYKHYWLNMDYYNMDFYDYNGKKHIINESSLNLYPKRLHQKSKQSWRNALIENKIIFATAEDAMNGCQFYANCNIPVERFKYIDWIDVAKDYHGVIIQNWKQQAQAMYYFWFQSLDVSSGCIWDIDGIASHNLLYFAVHSNKSNINKWLRA